MARKRAPIYVKITGTGISEEFAALSHEIVGLPAGTYHKFEMPTGAVTYFNDFGVRTVVIADAPEDLK